MVERRFFSGRERVALYLAAGGRCTECGAELEPGWHADHVDPHSRGGVTDVINGQESISAGDAEFDRAILGGEETSPDDYAAAQAKCRELGIPAQYALNILPLMGKASVALPAPMPTLSPQHRREKLLRQTVETLARKVAFKAGVPPKQVNIDLRKAGHPPRAKATITELEQIEGLLAKWLGDL